MKRYVKILLHLLTILQGSPTDLSASNDKEKGKFILVECITDNGSWRSLLC